MDTANFPFVGWAESSYEWVMETVAAFKEWQSVVAALASGRQALILRKGGIHEGRAGFSFAHDRFFLFPTRFHGQAECVREFQHAPLPEWQPGDEVPLTHYAEALWARTLTSAAVLDELAPFHIWTPATVAERFAWEGKGMATGSIHCALVRVYQLATPWMLEYGRMFAGCRSWVEVPAPPAGWRDALTPVLDDAEFGAIAERVARVLGPV
jgi:hypothetical protein